LRDRLTNITGDLEDITADQNATIAALRATLTGFLDENDRLAGLNDDLSTVVTFLNGTSTDLQASLAQVTSFLADQINANSVIVMRSLENNYLQRIANWDCDYRDVFRGKDFGSNFDNPIPLGDLPQVVNYVNARVLNEICLDQSDFAQYLQEAFPTGVTSFNLLSAVTIYTREALDFYFPEAGERGLSKQQWAAAGYRCSNLTTTFDFPDVII
jgi:hypothetical protein